MGFISNLFKPIKKIVHTIGHIAGKIWHSIKKGAKNTYDFVRKYWKEILFGIIGGYALTRNRLGSFLKKIGGKFGDGIKNFWNGLSKIIIWLKDKVMMVYNKVYKVISPVVEKLKNFYNKYAKPVVDFINKYVNKIKKALYKVNQISQVVKAIKDRKILKAFVKAFKLIDEKLYNQIKRTFKKAKDNITGLAIAIGQIFNKIKSDINKIMINVNKIGQEIKETALNMGWKKISNIGDAIQKIAIKTFEKVRVKIGKINTTLSNAINLLASPLATYLQVANISERELTKYKPYFDKTLNKMVFGKNNIKLIPFKFNNEKINNLTNINNNYSFQKDRVIQLLNSSLEAIFGAEFTG